MTMDYKMVIPMVIQKDYKKDSLMTMDYKMERRSLKDSLKETLMMI